MDIFKQNTVELARAAHKNLEKSLGLEGCHYLRHGKHQLRFQYPSSMLILERDELMWES